MQTPHSSSCINPSTFLVAAWIFFGQKDHGHQLCTDYRALNAVPVKYHYSWPLVPLALKQVQGTQIFTKHGPYSEEKKILHLATISVLTCKVSAALISNPK